METGVQTPHAASSPRSFNVSFHDVSHSFLIPSGLFPLASQLRDEFLAQLEQRTAGADDDQSSAGPLEVVDPAQLIALWVGHLAAATTELDTAQVLSVVLAEFERTFLAGNDVHALVAKIDLPSADAQEMTGDYFRGRTALNRPAKGHESALFRSATSHANVPGPNESKVFAIFGGQGYEDYFTELVKNYHTYNFVIADFVREQGMYLQELAKLERTPYHKGLDVLRWIVDPASRPDVDYLVSAAVSLPIIALSQLCNYMIAARLLGLTPGQMRAKLSGATGHSQGVITAVAIAASDSWADYSKNSRTCIELLFWLGAVPSKVYPSTSLPPSVLTDSLAENEGQPSPMLSIRDLPRRLLDKEIEATNQHLPESASIQVSLVNGPRNVVVSGPPKSLYGLNLSLRKIKAASGENQARVPHSKRKIRFSTRFLKITLPYHGKYLAPAKDEILKIIGERGLAFTGPTTIPVFATDDGHDLSANEAKDPAKLMEALIDLILTLPVIWEEATRFPNATHIIDFGPGENGGIGFLTHRNKDGLGIRVIFASSFAGGECGSKAELFDRAEGSIYRAVNWTDAFQPRLLQTSTGRVVVDTRMSRLLGLPPIMVAGMTPSTVHWEFVRDTMNAGYYIELAGGGYYSPAQLEAACQKIEASTLPGQGICINCIYINPRTFGWQIALVKQLRAAGVPIVGLTVAAGIPSIEVAGELINDLGVRFIGLKPGSAEAISQVIAIARAHKDFPILCQWTGGRAGGHHSYEDFHTPMLSMYSGLRKCKNIVLVAGSGFGGADDTLPYLTGEWSEAYNHPRMPFDGILLASRVMAAKEAKTSRGAKQAIVDAPGLDDGDWEKTYSGAAGGVITVRSELGEPIHKLATRGILLWRELDDTIFAVPKPKRRDAVLQKKDYLIKRLNADFQKVYFPATLAQRKADNEKWIWQAASDLEDMTYAEVTYRLIDLTYVLHESRWIDKTLRNLVGDWIHRIEERFTRDDGVESKLQSFNQLESPFPIVHNILEAYPEASTQMLNAQDVQQFLTLCGRRGQKPVPFIPVLDENLEVYFKKDSLWQSEDLEAVVDQDVGRVAILQGPMSARHSTIVDEPIKHILDSIHESHIKSLKEMYYNNDASKIPTLEYFGGCSVEEFGNSEAASNLCVKTLPALPSVRINVANNVTTLDIGTETSGKPLPDADAWMNYIAGSERSWRRALFNSENIVQGSKLESNPMRHVFAPRFGQRIEIISGDKPKIILYERQNGEHVKAVDVEQTERGTICVNMWENRNALHKPVALQLLFTYHPDCGFAPIREVLDGRNLRIKRFYWALWFGDTPYPEDLKSSSTFDCEKTIIDGKDIQSFCHVIGNHGEEYVRRDSNSLRSAPMDFAIVVGWKAIIQAIFPADIDGDMLKLVHLSNGFRRFPGEKLLREGDEVYTTASISAVTNSISGKTVEVTGTIYREEKPVMEVISKFLFRGVFTDYPNTFRKTVETPTSVKLRSQRDVAVLCSKEWFSLDDPSQDLTNCELTFQLQSFARFRDKTVMSHVETKGAVLLELPTKEVVQVASVDYEAENAHENPVIAYLKRHGEPLDQPVPFENGGYSVIQISEDIYSSSTVTPPSNSPYAEISGDYNPIHVSPTFAAYVQLPGIDGITHGMYSSAATRIFVETFAAENSPERVVAYDATFVDMVLPNTRLQTKLSHTGMIKGKKIIKVETFNAETGAKVLEGTAEVEQPITTYVFTGQGSQEQGMGMDLYASSPVARDIWNRADKHFLDNYGFSILNIVRNNPKQLTVHFGGAKGRAIKSNYMNMVYEMVRPDGTVESTPIFKEITPEKTSYTFQSPNGLLYATQFTQPALTLMEKAAFEDMRSKGLVQDNCTFAGHSLGEYSALAAMGDVMPIESLVDIVFYRGLTMQVAVDRDEQGRSDYAMVAVNPSRISKTFTDSILRYVVDKIAEQNSQLLEIVNYNVENQQYVTAGELTALDTLANVLNFIKMQGIDINKLQQRMSIEELNEHLKEIISECTERSLAKKAQQGYLKLERGYATIPLNVDVPFHSSFLRSGVRPFRQYLGKRILRTQIDPQKLIGKYIPNVTAKPFSISKEYFEEVYKLTGSARLGQIINNWDKYEDS